jgi:secreted Zn-dependent insulinase-like peptidase
VTSFSIQTTVTFNISFTQVSFLAFIYSFIHSFIHSFIIFVASVEHVDARIEAFLKRFSKMLKKMQEKELEEVRISLIKLKQLSDIDLEEEVCRNWKEITSRNYMFDRLEREVSDCVLSFACV